MSNLSATIEYGIGGYRLKVEQFNATSIAELVIQINNKTDEWAKVLEKADKRDGDLRQFTPEFGNGYMSLAGVGAEFGDGELFDGCLTELMLNDSELGYRTVGHRRVRKGAGLN